MVDKAEVESAAATGRPNTCQWRMKVGSAANHLVWWLVGCLVGWLATAWMGCRLVGWLVSWSAGWLVMAG